MLDPARRGLLLLVIEGLSPPIYPSCSPARTLALRRVEPLGGGGLHPGGPRRHRPAARPGGRASLDALAAPPALPAGASHVAFAIGIAFLIAPSGWLLRLVAPC
jgi:putative thiamine transport system permease protein